MGELTYLLSSYSGSELVIIFVAGLLIVTAILKACSFLWEKVKDYFNIKSNESQWKSTLTGKLDNIAEDTSFLKDEVAEMKDSAAQRAERLKKVEEFVKIDYDREEEILNKIEALNIELNGITDRLQDDARWAFKDAYNYYVVNKGSIDPLSLESLESKYDHYQKSNGNTFVHDVMEQIRKLPIKTYNKKSEVGDEDAN